MGSSFTNISSYQNKIAYNTYSEALTRTLYIELPFLVAFEPRPPIHILCLTFNGGDSSRWIGNLNG